MVSVTDIERARARLAGRLHRTPTVSATSLGARVGARLWLKAELFQKTGSFKPRGVLNKLLTLSDAERRRGFVSLSAGNHAQALAWGAAQVGSHAVVIMPARAARSKIDATRAYGGEVVLTERPLLDVCHEVRDERRLVLVHPFDDPVVIAGAGTVGLEVLEDAAEVRTVVVPVGGGGLLSGVAAAIKGSRSDVRVVGVEPEGSDVMSRSLAAGRPERLERSDTIADGLAAPFVGEVTLAHTQRFVDEVVRVSEEAIQEAMRALLRRAKLVCEPAGAASYAALLEARLDPGEGQVVCIVSGGNVDDEVLRRVLASA